jgi:hypothetical protein
MIRVFDRTSAKMLGAEIEAALQDVARKHGIAIRRGHGTFDNSNFALKVECSVIDQGTGEAITREKRDFTAYATLYGLEPSDLGRQFEFRGHIYTITGLKTGASRFPILAERGADGKTFKFPVDTIKARLAGRPPSPRAEEFENEGVA